MMKSKVTLQDLQHSRETACYRPPNQALAQGSRLRVCRASRSALGLAARRRLNSQPRTAALQVDLRSPCAVREPWRLPMNSRERGHPCRRVPITEIAPARMLALPDAVRSMRWLRLLCIWGSLCLALLWLPFIQPVAAQDIVTTLAGQALVIGISNGFGTNALCTDAAAITIDLKGNLYLADSQNHAIRKNDTKGHVSTR